jgi:hypothetical protein
MLKPNFNNLERFAVKCTTNTNDNLVVSQQEAKAVVLDYQKLLAYCLDLQNKLIEIEKELATPTEIEIKSSNF